MLQEDSCKVLDDPCDALEAGEVLDDPCEPLHDVERRLEEDDVVLDDLSKALDVSWSVPVLLVARVDDSSSSASSMLSLLLYIRTDDDLLSLTGAAKMTSVPRHLTFDPGDNVHKSPTRLPSMDTGL